MFAYCDAFRELEVHGTRSFTLCKACHDFHVAGEASGNVIAVGDDDGMVNLYRLTGTLGAWLMQPHSKLTLHSMKFAFEE